MLFLYNILLYFFKTLAPSFLYFSSKGREWLEGQKKISGAIVSIEHKYISSKCIWMHCASLGEYEQGKPVLWALKEKYPDHKLILTFFSPSGFKLPAAFFLADDVYPLPLDGEKAAKTWIMAIHPEIAIFVKQEFWYHYLRELNLQKIPVFLISGTMSSSSLLKFPFYKNWYLNICRFFNILFLQSEKDVVIAANYPLENALLSGNTRVDSVIKNKELEWKNEIINSFTSQSDVIFFGSAWPVDIPILQHFMANPLFKKWKIIWAPHDISPKQKNILLDALDDKKSIIFLSDANLEVQNNRILVLDTIGMLKYAYRYAKLVYIGGGFGKGIHNLLEPMVYHLPVVFGPNHLAFPEARYLVENGGGFCINNLKDWDAVLEKLNIPAFRDNCGIIASSYIAENMGTMDKILPYLYTVLDKNEQG